MGDLHDPWKPKACPHCGHDGAFDSLGGFTRKMSSRTLDGEGKVEKFQRWDHHHCPDCEQEFALLNKTVRREYDKTDEEHTERKELVTDGGRDTAAIQRWTGDIHQGDSVETLAEMPESSVHSVMTSPPYYGLRDYGADGQIGLEESLDDYIGSLLEVADELRRVLRDDGSWWLNLGDSFAGSWGAQSKDETENNLPQHDHPDKNPARNGQMRRKNKMLVPHRVAIALQDAGWIVRADCPWVKPNPMPHPVKDRLLERKEFVFHITPEPDYWFDLDAVREPHKESSLNRQQQGNYHTSGSQMLNTPRDAKPEHVLMKAEDALHPNGKNPGDVFEIPVKAFPEAHFAVYPPELCETPIKATCPTSVCAECGAPFERSDEGVPGSEQRCDCETDETEPGIILDPFAGAGTTALVAKKLGRRFVGIDLNPDYVALAQKRVGVTVDEPDRLLEDGETALTAFADGGRE